jgi:hypothetical protein
MITAKGDVSFLPHQHHLQPNPYCDDKTPAPCAAEQLEHPVWGVGSPG